MKKRKYPVSFVFLSFILVFALLICVLPESGYSENEKRYLAAFPEFNWKSITDGSFFQGFETYISDHFPFRDAFVGINAYYTLLTGRNGVSGVYKAKDGYLIAAAGALDLERCERNAKLLHDFSEANDLPTTVILVPTAGYMLDAKLPKNHGPYFDDEIFAVAKAYFGDDLIDLRQDFKENLDKTQIYYKTDHHLTAAGSYLMYQAYCREKMLDAIADFPEVEVLEDFYGTNYSKSGLWFEKPDELEIWHNTLNSEFEVTIDDVTGSAVYDSLYFRAHEKNADKYPVYLDGNHAIVKIRNLSNPNGKKLLILKDSYSHCFATYLCENYEEIYMVDLRYYRLSVSELVRQSGITELLCLYGAENFASLSDIGWLR